MVRTDWPGSGFAFRDETSMGMNDRAPTSGILRFAAQHGFALAALGLVALLSLHCAKVRPLWIDEFLTLKLARADDLGELWYLLATGPQSDPPLFYLAARASMAVP